MAKKISKLYGYNLWVSAQSWQRSFNRILEPYELTHAQYIVLHYMCWAQKKDALSTLSQNQLAYNLSLDPMMVSNILKTLDRKGYILKSSLGAGSANRLSVTKDGKKLVKGLKKPIKKFEKKLFKYFDGPMKEMLQSVVIQSQDTVS